MILDNPNLFSLEVLFFVFKIGFVLFAVLYFLFSLIIVRQATLMTQTVITEAGLLIRMISILHAIIALFVVVFLILLLF